MWRHGLSLALWALLSACSVVHYQLPADQSSATVALTPELQAHQQRRDQLEQQLLGLGMQIDPAEAQQVANTAVYYSLQLANQYQLTSPPLFHNVLVNAGIKPRGLCIHWTEDLLSKLKSLQLKSFDFYWGVANKNVPLRIEHSTVVATARHQDFKQGIVLDPWRDSGILYFGKLTADSYDWQLWR